MVAMTKIKIADAIFLVRFKTQYEVASTFLRFQEHFESRRFSGHVFTLEEFMDWYAAEYGNFTYYQDWSGFNIPSTVLAPFYEGSFDPLLKKEQRLLELFKNERHPFYVMGMSASSSPSELSHELAHALFFTDPIYKSAVIAAMKRHDTSVLEKNLHRAGYSKSVLRDEAHSYVLTSTTGLLDNHGTRKLAPLRKELQAIFSAHGANLLKSAVKRLRMR